MKNLSISTIILGLALYQTNTQCLIQKITLNTSDHHSITLIDESKLAAYCNVDARGFVRYGGFSPHPDPGFASRGYTQVISADRAKRIYKILKLRYFHQQSGTSPAIQLLLNIQ